MPNHFLIHELLSSSELEELETFAREPGRTHEEIGGYLQDHGHTVSKSSVGRWKQMFDQRVMAERMSRSGEMAKAIKGAVSNGSFGDVADAAVMQLTQVVFEQASSLQADGKVDALDVQRMTKSLVNLVGSKAVLTKMLAEKFDKESQKLVASRRQITDADIAEVRKAVFG